MPAKRSFKFNFRFDFDQDPLAKQPARPIKHLPPGGALVEVTTRTIQGRFLLKPGTRANDTILGILGRALSRHPTVRLSGVHFLSNHYNLLAFFEDVYKMSAFMDYVNGCLGREMGLLHDWTEKIFGRPYRGIVIVDPGAEAPRLAYLLAQGTKEGLVERPDQWPGVSCLKSLLTGAVMKGTWRDRTGFYRASRHNPKLRRKDFEETYEVPLHPIPSWAHVPVEEQRRRVEEIVRQIEEHARETNARLKRKPMGAKKILEQNPHDHPRSIAKSPAPLCHASSRGSFWRYANTYRAWVKAYQKASREFRAGDLMALGRFPPGCFLPRPGPGLIARVVAGA